MIDTYKNVFEDIAVYQKWRKENCYNCSKFNLMLDIYNTALCEMELAANANIIGIIRANEIGLDPDFSKPCQIKEPIISKIANIIRKFRLRIYAYN